MRIAMVSEHASPLAVLGGREAGGQNVHVGSLAAALADLGHTVEVFTRRDSRRLPRAVRWRPGVTVIHVPAGPPSPVPRDDLAPYMSEFGRRLADRWWRAGLRPDVVHAHFWMSGMASLNAGQDLGIPVVQTFHALGSVKRRHLGPADPSPAIREGTERDLLDRADAVIATCRDELRELEAMGSSTSTASVIPCGIDPAVFTPSGPAWSRPADRPRVVCLGRLVERKGVDTVVAALRHVPRAELLIAGGPAPAGLDRDGDARRLRAIADRHGVADRVRLLGRLDRRRVARLLRSADALVSVPHYEPFGIVPVEAMACGVPVVVSAVGGMLDTVVNGVTGLHVPPGDEVAVGGALRSLLQDADRRSRMGAAGARAAARYAWPSIARQTLTIYRGLVLRRLGHHTPAGFTDESRAAG